MEDDKVAEIVGVVSLRRSSAPVWFDITGEREEGAEAWGGGRGETKTSSRGALKHTMHDFRLILR